VLAVDDDHFALELVEAVLQPEYDLETALDAETAIERYETFRPDLVILDLRLRDGTDGMDVFHELRRRFGLPPPAIVLSSADEAEATARALRIPVFRKPITRGLLAVVRDALEQNAKRPASPDDVLPGARVSAEVDGKVRLGTVTQVGGGIVQFRDDAGLLLFAARERVTLVR
jgi:DNA-binding response OmpR family regulator